MKDVLQRHISSGQMFYLVVIEHFGKNYMWKIICGGGASRTPHTGARWTYVQLAPQCVSITILILFALRWAFNGLSSTNLILCTDS